MIFLVLFLLRIAFDIWKLLWSHMELPICGFDYKESACDVETRVQSLYQEDPLAKGMLITQVFLPGEFQRQKTLRSQRVGHD